MNTTVFRVYYRHFSGVQPNGKKIVISLSSVHGVSFLWSESQSRMILRLATMSKPFRLDIFAYFSFVLLFYIINMRAWMYLESFLRFGGEIMTTIITRR